MNRKWVQKDEGSGIPQWWGRSFAILMFLVSATLGVAQLDTGTISGSVIDPSGAAVPATTVTIRNVETGISRTLQTGPTGRYEAIALAVGDYEVRASLPGFQTTVRSGITLTVGRNAVVDMTLQVGEVTQAITVAGEASFVETTTATVSSLVNERQVLDIPLNNRDLTQLTYLQPGVIQYPRTAGGTRSHKNGQGNQIAVAGARPRQNVFLLDGISNEDMSGNPQTASTAYTGAETVQEFQIITNNYSAEYPSKPGGIVSAVTKSGTNSFHGSAYEFLRNDNLDAAEWEDNAFAGEKPEFKRNHYGASLGGPILRDRTFFFANYEGLRERVSSTGTYEIPSADGRRGILGSKTVEVNPAVVPFLAVWPLPGQGNALIEDFGDGRALVSATVRQPTNEDFGTVKVDHQFGSEKAGFLAVTYNSVDSDTSTLGLLPNNTSRAYFTRKHVLSTRHTSILSPTALNELVFGYSDIAPRGDVPAIPVDFANFNGVDLRWNPELENMGDINIQDVDPVGYEADGSSYGTKTLTIKENVSLTRPSHTFKFGMEYNRFRHPLHIASGNDNGNFGFDDLELFLQAVPSNFQITLPTGAMVQGQPHRNLRDYNIAYSLFGFYLQDNWKVLPSLTFNLGLRYEFMTLPTERDGNVATLRNFMDPSFTVGPLFTNPTKRSFSPRFGFAWSPGDRRTSLRGGFGIYYDHPVLHRWNSSLGEMPPIQVAGGIRDTDVDLIDFPNALFTQGDRLASTPNGRFTQFEARPTYVYRWSLTLQRELGPWIMSAGYSGLRAAHLIVSMDGNINRWDGWPEQVPTGDKFFRSNSGAINPAFNTMWPQAPFGNSYYNALQVNVQRRLTAGLQFQGAYTFSKNIDQGSSVSGGDGTFQHQREAYYWDTGHRKGPAIFDIRNVFVTNLTYDLPQTALTGVAAAVLNGWQINGILSLQDGHAYTITDRRNRDQRRAMRATSTRVNLIPNGDNNPVLGTPSSGQKRYFDVSQFVPSVCRGATVCSPGDADYQPGYFGNLGMNTLSVPGVATLDFSLNKSFLLTEGSRLQLRTEFFNMFNRPNFGRPDADPFLSNGRPDTRSGAVIRQTRGSARQIQFGLKFIF